MCVIGLTGGLASGKTTVARMFGDLGAQIIDADKIAHRQLRKGSLCYNRIIRLLGREILVSGKIDRRKVASRVFNNHQLLQKLERIVHPVVRKTIIHLIEVNNRRRRKRIIVLDVPLLYETKLDKLVDVTIVVQASRAAQLQRAVNGLHITKADAQRRLKAQMPLQKKIRMADILIDNNKTLTITQKQVKRIWEKL